jgi:hypothetical protein
MTHYDISQFLYFSWEIDGGNKKKHTQWFSHLGLIACRRVILENLTVAHLTKKFREFGETNFLEL